MTELVERQAANNIWLTPPGVLAPVRAYFPGGVIPMDPATESHNPTGAKWFYTEEDDGLAKVWNPEGVFINPPYSTLVEPPETGDKEADKEALLLSKREYMEALKDVGERLFGLKRSYVSSLIVLWVVKIHREAERGVPILALLPCGARFGTAYWQDHILSPVELNAMCFWRGRVSFLDETGQTVKGNLYDSIMYGFNVDVDRFAAAFEPCGTVKRVQNVRIRPDMMDGFT